MKFEHPEEYCSDQYYLERTNSRINELEKTRLLTPVHKQSYIDDLINTNKALLNYLLNKLGFKNGQ
jgi:hypothetical protein